MKEDPRVAEHIDLSHAAQYYLPDIACLNQERSNPSKTEIFARRTRVDQAMGLCHRKAT